jgi:hypothetical protein
MWFCKFVYSRHKGTYAVLGHRSGTLLLLNINPTKVVFKCNDQ